MADQAARPFDDVHQIDRSTQNREKMAVCAQDKGRLAITHFEVVETYEGIDGRPLVSHQRLATAS